MRFFLKSAQKILNNISALLVRIYEKHFLEKSAQKILNNISALLVRIYEKNFLEIFILWYTNYILLYNK